MINKQSLWFITLFSLILILGIYYVSTPLDTMSVLSEDTDNTEAIEVTSSDVLVAIKVEEEEKILAQMEVLQNILLDEGKSAEEKNDAYLQLQSLNSKKGKVLEIEKLLKEKFKIDSCAVIEENKITITIAGEDQGKEFANSIIQAVQSLYDNQMYITVKFK